MIDETLPSLYLVTKEYEADNQLLSGVQLLLESGVRLVQYRQKNLKPKHALRQALALRELTQAHQSKLIINDDISLALKVRADGIHLGELDSSVEEVISVLSQIPKPQSL